MDDIGAHLQRIAAALERLAPAPLALPDWLAYPAYVWGAAGGTALQVLNALPLDLLTGIDDQKTALVENTRRHAAGLPAHDILLWGSRGMGKSALAKAAILDDIVQQHPVALVQIGTTQKALNSLPKLFEILAKIERRFILFIDDIGFDEGADGAGAAASARSLRSLLDGGATQRPDNVRLYVTSNRRHIVSRQMSEQDDPINPRDAIDDRLALADRFGLSLGFHACSQADYLRIVSAYAAGLGLKYDEADALIWAKQRGNRSGRIAWHYITEIAGRAGKPITV